MAERYLAAPQKMRDRAARRQSAIDVADIELGVGADKEKWDVKQHPDTGRKVTDPPKSRKEYEQRLSGLTTKKQRDAFIKEHGGIYEPPIPASEWIGRVKSRAAGRKGLRGAKRGGTVSRNMGGKIMYGYKAGGKV